MIKKYYLIFILFFVSGVAIVLLPHKPSFWGDELLGGVSFTGASSIKEFLSVQWSVGPEVAPIYPVILYMNSKYLHIPLDKFRYFSVVCYLLCSFFIYLTILKLVDRKTAFLTSFSVALLPIHLWHSMLLRPHALAFLLSVVSFYFFTLIYKENSLKFKYLFSLYLVNIALIFTHYIFFWVPFAECLFLIFNKKREKRVIIFLLANFIIIGGVIFYLGFFVRTNNIAFVPEKGVKQLVSAILGLLDFEISSINSWAIYIQPLFFIHKPMPTGLEFLLRVTPLVIIYGGNILFSFLILYLLVKKLIFILKSKSIPSDISFYLLFFAVILPTLFALIQIVSGTNILMARYFFLSWVCKIALLFIFLNQILSKRFRYLLTVVVLVFFIHHYILYRSCSPYSDWNSCAKYIQNSLTNEDIIITGRFEEALTLEYAFSDLDKIPIFFPTSMNSAMDGISFLQNQNPSSNIWLVYSMQWNDKIPCILREELKRRGIDFHENIFPSYEGIVCYQIQINAKKSNGIVSSYDSTYHCNAKYNWEEEKRMRKDEMKSILEKSEGSVIDKENLLNWLIFPDGTAGTNTIPQLTFQFIAMNKNREIQTLCEHFNEQTIWATVGLIFTLTEDGEIEKAEQTFDDLTKKNFYLANLLKPLWEEYAKRRYDEFLQKCEPLKKAGFPLAHLLDVVIHLRMDNKGQEILQLGVLPYNEKAKRLLKSDLSDLSDELDKSDRLEQQHF